MHRERTQSSSLRSRGARVLLAAATTFSIAGCAAHHRPRPRSASWATTRPWLTSQPTTRLSVTVSEVTVQTLPVQTYFFLSSRTTFAQLQSVIERSMLELQQAAADGRVAFPDRQLLSTMARLRN